MRRSQTRLARAGPQNEYAAHATGPPKSEEAPEVLSASDAVARSTRAAKNSSYPTTLTQPVSATISTAALTAGAGDERHRTARRHADWWLHVSRRYRRGLADLAGVAASMAEIGLLQPVVIRPDGKLIASVGDALFRDTLAQTYQFIE